jgi:hypothetical protein
MRRCRNARFHRGIVKLSCYLPDFGDEQQSKSLPQAQVPPQIISHAVWLYHRCSLSFRDMECGYGCSSNPATPERRLHPRTIKLTTPTRGNDRAPTRGNVFHTNLAVLCPKP